MQFAFHAYLITWGLRGSLKREREKKNTGVMRTTTRSQKSLHITQLQLNNWTIETTKSANHIYGSPMTNGFTSLLFFFKFICSYTPCLVLRSIGITKSIWITGFDGRKVFTPPNPNKQKNLFESGCEGGDSFNGSALSHLYRWINNSWLLRYRDWTVYLTLSRATTFSGFL